MKFWEKYSRNISNGLINRYLQNNGIVDIRNILNNGASLLENDIIEEIKAFIIKSITYEGGFINRGGLPDVYYSLFGSFIVDALNIEIDKKLLIQFINNHKFNSNNNVELFCKSIIFSIFDDAVSPSENFYIEEIKHILQHTDFQDFEYTSFMGLLALFYAKELWFLNKFLKRANILNINNLYSKPCSVIAAIAILKTASRQDTQIIENQILKNFYNGGFYAVKGAPVTDLLSTAVALYALKCCGTELSQIKPSCLTFVDNHFCDGGFVATTLDNQPDLEYTFYGLLALGSLA